MIVYVTAMPNGDRTYHDSEQAAERAAAELVASRTATAAVAYRMVVEPEIRLPGYWERTRGAAA